MTAPHRRYALLVAADALEADDRTLQDLIADDDRAALLTAPQVINALRILAALEPAGAKSRKRADAWNWGGSDMTPGEPK